jgi:hypothetical protein
MDREFAPVYGNGISWHDESLEPLSILMNAAAHEGMSRGGSVNLRKPPYPGEPRCGDSHKKIISREMIRKIFLLLPGQLPSLLFSPRFNILWKPDFSQEPE